MVYARALLGILAFCLFAWLLADGRRKVPWRIVLVGILLQVILGLLILRTSAGNRAFDAAAEFVTRLMELTEYGTDIVFGDVISKGNLDGPVGFVFAFSGRGLPSIIFFSALVSILYYLGAMQFVVWLLARAMTVLMGVSGAEAMCMAANIFVGQTEAALTVRYYMPRMTRSELNSVMTGGFATMAASMIAIYIGVLGHNHYYGRHLLAAEVMSAPAAFVICKLIRPEFEEPETRGRIPLRIGDRKAHNLLEAAANGTRDGVTLWLNVVAMLITFTALVALVDWGLGAINPRLSLGFLFGQALGPVAWLLGIDNWHDSKLVGSILGTKIATNEFVAYLALAKLLPASTATTMPAIGVTGTLSQRSAILAVYAIADFANFVSIGIQIGGLTPLAPDRKTDYPRLALRAMLGGCLASYMTAAIAGMFV
jgi:CNT family concentrative nucleoside transporter